LSARGHDPELVTLITGYGDTGAALITAGVEKVLFIGSPATGKKVMSSATENLTAMVLELGGKDPFIVLDDAHLDNAVDVALRGVYVNCGQNCIASERILVHEKVHDQFVERVVAKVKQLRQGVAKDGVCDCGSMSMPLGLKKVDELV